MHRVLFCNILKINNFLVIYQKYLFESENNACQINKNYDNKLVTDVMSEKFVLILLRFL